jgi:hypothetical protein
MWLWRGSGVDCETNSGLTAQGGMQYINAINSQL